MARNYISKAEFCEQTGIDPNCWIFDNANEHASFWTDEKGRAYFDNGVSDFVRRFKKDDEYVYVTMSSWNYDCWHEFGRIK